MLALPPAFLEQLALTARSTVGIALEGSRIIVEPKRPRYTLAELLAQCDVMADRPADEAEWTSGGSVGNEII
ncbi:MAG: antitoxin [Rhodospirillaceae bacterium]